MLAVVGTPAGVNTINPDEPIGGRLSTPLSPEHQTTIDAPHLYWPENVDVNNHPLRQSYVADFSQVFSRTAWRTLLITKDGYLGAGPGNAGIGDKLFLPRGCSVPLVIRPSSDRFEVVADAYVCGVMQGEMHAGVDAEKPDLVDIVLQ